MSDMHSLLIAAILGVVEGLTEFLPVSSTGHMIIVGHLLGFEGDTAKTFEVVIQLGSILAVVVMFWRRLFGLIGIHFGRPLQHEGESKGRLTLIHILLGMIPAVVLGLLFHNKAINGERDKRNALNQLQEGFNRYQRHHKSGDKPNGKHRDIAGCQEAPAFVEIERRCAHHHRYRQQERELGSSVTAHAHQHPT